MSAEAHDVLLEANLPTKCPRCGRPSQGSPITDAGAHCCDECYKGSTGPWPKAQPTHSVSCDAHAHVKSIPRKRHEAAIQISQERLKALLDIPEDWNLIGAKHDPFSGSTVTLLFSHPDLYPLGEGMVAPVIASTYNIPGNRQ